MGLSIGLDTATTGLRAMQLAIDTTAHNIANADTEGYSRQEVMLRAIPPVKAKFTSPNIPIQQIGLGVDASRIRRIRDVLLDTQYRDVRGLRDEYSARASALQQAEVILNEPSNEGLQALLTRYFNGFRDLASQPESIAARAAVIETGETLSAAFNRANRLFLAQRTDLDAAVDVKVQDINAEAQEIADLNAQIRKIAVTGGTSNDLHDRRDLLLDELTGLAGVTVQAGGDDTVNVYLGARALVNNVTVDALTTQPDPLNNNLRRVVFASDNAAATITTGEIKGILDGRDIHVAGMLTRLDDLASTLITAVNTYHQTGFGLDNVTGLNFFTGTTAADIGVNATLQNSPESLGTSDAANEPGNPDVARLIAGVQNELLMAGGTVTIDDSYRALVARLGVESQQAQTLVESQDVLTRHIDTARQGIMGVSIDEEMTNLVKHQHAYSASAKVISVVNEMLDTLVNRTI
jgi:flagellar hook-associated protein 1